MQKNAYFICFLPKIKGWKMFFLHFIKKSIAKQGKTV